MKQESILDAAIKNKKPTFLKSWTTQQFKQVERSILRHFLKVGEIKTDSGHGILHPIYSYSGVNSYLGLAYTSSGDYAGLWVCNVSAINDKYPGYHYIGFALGEDNKAYGVLWDKDENEITIQI